MTLRFPSPPVSAADLLLDRTFQGHRRATPWNCDPRMCHRRAHRASGHAPSPAEPRAELSAVEPERIPRTSRRIFFLECEPAYIRYSVRFIVCSHRLMTYAVQGATLYTHSANHPCMPCQENANAPKNADFRPALHTICKPCRAASWTLISSEEFVRDSAAPHFSRRDMRTRDSRRRGIRNRGNRSREGIPNSPQIRTRSTRKRDSRKRGIRNSPAAA